MDPVLRERLERVYAEHPQSARAILARIQRERGSLAGITARHLAEAVGGGPTDQNHTGGAAVVRDLARVMAVEPAWRVLDVGTGLGGTPRVLAEECGCWCHGVELTRTRYADALRLTTLVGLQDRVTFSLGDFMEVEIPGGPFNLAIAQGALLHLPDLQAALRRIANLLVPSGRIAIEDGVLLRTPATADERRDLERLSWLWNVTFPMMDAWPALLTAAGFRFDGVDDLASMAATDLEQWLEQSADGALGSVTDDEREAWELGRALNRAGLLGSARVKGTLGRV